MKNNFTLAEILLMCLVSASLFAQNFNYISDYDGQGVPLDMVNTSVSQSLLDNIEASFPEGYPVPDYNPQYISDDIETNVVLTETADVWVTFVGEGAGYKNVLGYYTYDAFDPPTSMPADEDITIIFPNVSAAGSGGGLIAGDKMYLGQFPPNTVIGWVLIANGWNGNQVTYGNWMLYSNPYFNPEGSPELQKHNVNLYDNNEQVVVFGFEDIRRDFSSCDQDFNDALFLVTSNPYTAMDTDNFNSISYDGGNQSSGNDGGLESHRGLSSSIAKRFYNRNKTNIFRESAAMQSRSNALLSELVPASIKEGDERIISTPVDLLDIIDVEEIWSVDYKFDDECIATVFATETTEKIYDHTKVVCDRLAGTEIQDIREVQILGQKYLLTTLKRDDNSIEYTISFSILLDLNKKFRVFSKWAVDQYEETGNFLNYQVWSAAPYSTVELVKQIIQNVQENRIYVGAEDSISYLPKVYVKSGKYDENEIKLTLMNTQSFPATCSLVGTFSDSEMDQELEMLLKTIKVAPGENEFVVNNPNGSIYDLELRIKEVGQQAYDVAYFSDGAWGMDYDSEKTNVSMLEISPNMRMNEDEFNISRDIIAQIDSDDYISIFKHFGPSGKTVDLSRYNALIFESDFKSPTTIRIIDKDISDWEDQFFFVYNPDNDTHESTIPFSYFRNSKNEPFVPDNAQMIVFTQDQSKGIDQNLMLRNLRFVNAEVPELSIEEVRIFPNPSTGNISLNFESDETKVGVITVCNLIGKIVHKEKIQINKGFNVIEQNLKPIEKGLHVVSIELGDGVQLNSKIIFF